MQITRLSEQNLVEKSVGEVISNLLQPMVVKNQFSTKTEQQNGKIVVTV
jgi:hypothetical protein